MALCEVKHATQIQPLKLRLTERLPALLLAALQQEHQTAR